jgi:lipopolysaccharide assembly protein A
MLISLIIAVAVTIVAVFFASYNLSVVTVNLFGYSVQGTVGLLMVVALGIGVLLGVLLMLPSVISRSWALMRHKRKLQELQNASVAEIMDDRQTSGPDGGE